MFKTQKIKTIFLAALFTACVLGFAQNSQAGLSGVTITPDLSCDFSSDSTEIYVNQSITFLSTSYSNGGTIMDYSWDFGDGSLDSGETVTHTFVESGAYTVRHYVTDNYGKLSIKTMTIVVNDLPEETQSLQSSTDTSTPQTEEVTVPQDTPVSNNPNIESGISPLEIIDLTISDILPNEIAATSEVASVTLPATLEGNSVQGISKEVDTQTQDTESVTLAGSYAQATI